MTRNYENIQPISPIQLEMANNFILKFKGELQRYSQPFISICGDGAIHLQWTTPQGNRGVVEVRNNNTYFWSFIPISEKYGDDEIFQLKSLNEALEKVQVLFKKYE